MTEAQVAQELQAFLTQVTPIRWMTPHDLAGHRQELARRLRVGDLSPYTRPFQFPDLDISQATALGQQVLRRVSEVPNHLRAIVQDKIESTLRQIQVVQSRDDDALNAWTIEAYGLPSAEVLREAEALVTQPTASREDSRTLSSDDIAAAIQHALKAYELDHWTVKIGPNMAANASVMGRTATVKISQTAQPTVQECRRLIAHEVGGHVLRWENARRQPIPWAQFAFGNSVPTEEGLAALVEEELDVATPSTLHRYAVRVLAVHASKTRNLLDLAFYLGALLPASEAASLALRVRRGIGSPTSTGGLTKDHGYLTGLLRSRRLATDDPDGLQLLRGTKWTIDYLPMAQVLAGQGYLTPASLVPIPELLGLSQIAH